MNAENPQEINRRLIEIAEMLDSVSKAHLVACEENARDEHAYKLGTAKAISTMLFGAEMPEKLTDPVAWLAAIKKKDRANTDALREAFKDIAVSELQRKAYLSRAKREGLKRRLDALERQINAVQSIGSNIRTEMRLAGFQS